MWRGRGRGYGPCTRRVLRVSNRIALARQVPARRYSQSLSRVLMSKLLRGLAAGYGAKKLGGGCFSTVLIFIILWWLLGHFGIFQ